MGPGQRASGNVFQRIVRFKVLNEKTQKILLRVMKSENFSKNLGNFLECLNIAFCNSENFLNLKWYYELSIFIRQNNMLLCASSPKGFKNFNFISKMPPFLFVLPWKQLMQPKLNLLHASNSFISWNLKIYTLLIIYYRYFNSWLLLQRSLPPYHFSKKWPKPTHQRLLVS